MVVSLSELKEPKLLEVGGKGYSLAILRNHKFNVPSGFIITADVFSAYLKDNNLLNKFKQLTSEINKENFTYQSEEIRKLTQRGKMSEKAKIEIDNNLEILENTNLCSIRSSAVGEDNINDSFAGLFDTYLNVRAEINSVVKNIIKCWASLYNERAVAYRLQKGVFQLDRIAVIVQKMIDADIAGTVFTAHPDTGDRSMIVVEAVKGLGNNLVSGYKTPDLYILNKKDLTILEKTIEGKQKDFCLNDEQLQELANTCKRVERLFKYPQDIEWCIKDNNIYILQSRPITSLNIEI